MIRLMPPFPLIHNRPTGRSNYLKILLSIKNQSPKTKVFVQSLLPRKAKFQKDIEGINNNLMELAEESGYRYIDRRQDMAEIIKVYRQSIPALRFIGKKYGDSDRVNGTFASKWGEWWQNGWFDILEKQTGVGISEIYEDGDAYLGLMRWKENEPFEYWIGMFLPENSPVPDSFTHIDFPGSELGVCWVYGKEGDVYLNERKCAEKLKEEGIEIIPDEKGALWFFERYGCPRFTVPDDKGNIILDICYFVK